MNYTGILTRLSWTDASKSALSIAADSGVAKILRTADDLYDVIGHTEIALIDFEDERLIAVVTRNWRIDMKTYRDMLHFGIGRDTPQPRDSKKAEDAKAPLVSVSEALNLTFPVVLVGGNPEWRGTMRDWLHANADAYPAGATHTMALLNEIVSTGETYIGGGSEPFYTLGIDREPIQSRQQIPAFERAREAISPGQAERRAAGKCATCGGERMRPENFRDPLSMKEAQISGMCQRCQDQVFAEPYESGVEAVRNLVAALEEAETYFVASLGAHEVEAPEISRALDKFSMVRGRAFNWLAENDEEIDPDE